MYKLVNEFELPTLEESDDNNPLQRIFRSFLSTQRNAFEDYVNGKYEDEEHFMYEVLELCLFAGLVYQGWKNNPEDFDLEGML